MGYGNDCDVEDKSALWVGWMTIFEFGSRRTVFLLLELVLSWPLAEDERRRLVEG